MKKTIQGFLTAKGFSKIPLLKSKARHLEVKTRINGISGRFILDTGASYTVVDAASAGKFKMKLLKKESNKGGGLGASSFSVKHSNGNVIKFKDFATDKRKILVMDFSHVNAALSNSGVGRVDGVIGADILNKYNALIDYKDKTLYLK
jgi:hypothetical protein